MQLAIRFSIEADILKELLKECRSFIEYVNAWDYGYELLDKIEEVLK